MNSFRFSPISNKDHLLNAIEYVHLETHKLCESTLGRFLPVAGNIGIFCHYEDEYRFLTKLREQLTETSDNWNQKYFRLYEPITISAQGDIPSATYTYLYIRKPDQHSEVGDVDFVLKEPDYSELRDKLLAGSTIKGMEILDRPDLNLIKLSDPIVDVLAFIGIKNMVENMESR